VAKQVKKMGIRAEEDLNQCLERTMPCAMGLIIQPFWGPGSNRPDAKSDGICRIIADIFHLPVEKGRP